MKIQVNTDKNIEGSQELELHITNELTSTLDRFRNAITRIEVHLSDANADKVSPNDKKCLLEARIANRSPITVSHSSDTIHQSITLASNKLEKALTSMAGKLTDHKSPRDFNNIED